VEVIIDIILVYTDIITYFGLFSMGFGNDTENQNICPIFLREVKKGRGEYTLFIYVAYLLKI